jgi:hypothetical protein
MPRIAVLALVSALALFPFAWWTGLWEEAGCIIDPGGCPAGPGTDEGCGIDPSGRCAPAPLRDEGGIIDPNGGACPDRQ